MLRLSEVNKQGGSSISWKKFGVLYSWKLSLALGHWIAKCDMPQPLPDVIAPKSEEEIRDFVMKLKLLPEPVELRRP